MSRTLRPSGQGPNPTPIGAMSFRQAWKLSKIPYVELSYKSSKLIGSSGSADVDAKHFKSMLNAGKANKVRFTIFVCLGAAIPFAVSAPNLTPFSLVSAIALGLTVSFAYLVLYALQITPAFASSEAYSLMLTLPFSDRDFSVIAMLSFIRTFDYLAVGSILVPSFAVAALTQSIGATILMFGAATINVLLAIFAGLWLSRLFYKNITRGGRSRGAELARTVFIITWGLAALSIGFAFYSVTYLLPYLNQILAGGPSQAPGVVLLFLHPFTFGLTVSSLVFRSTFNSSAIPSGALSYVASMAYVVAGLLAVNRTSRMISGISHGQGSAIIRQVAKEFALKLRRPLVAFVVKDLRIASKNPATALILALPLFGPLTLIAFSNPATGGALDVAIWTTIEATFPLVAGYLLIYTETTALQYTLSLPISTRMIVKSKSLISTLVYLPIPLVVPLLQHAESGVWSLASLIPSAEILAINAATTAEIALLIKGSGASGGSRIGPTIRAYATAIAMIVVPVASYLITSAVYAESASILVMAMVAVLELAIANAALRLKG
jgi:predicted permease